jgi:hypothetical protein
MSDTCAEFLTTAIHEAGHAVVAESFGYFSAAITTEGHGLTLMPETENYWHSLAMDWGGLVAQAIRGMSPNSMPVPIPIDASNLEQWVRDALKMYPNPRPGHDLFRSSRVPFSHAHYGASTAYDILLKRPAELSNKIQEQLKAVERATVHGKEAIEQFREETMRRYRERRTQTL